MKTTVWFLLVICLIKVKEMVNYIFAAMTMTVMMLMTMTGMCGKWTVKWVERRWSGGRRHLCYYLQCTMCSVHCTACAPCTMHHEQCALSWSTLCVCVLVFLLLHFFPVFLLSAICTFQFLDALASLRPRTPRIAIENLRIQTWILRLSVTNVSPICQISIL